MLALAALSLSSCTEKVPVGPEMQTVLVRVKAKDWAYSNSDNNNYFYATADMPELTERVLKGGMVKMYRVYDYNTMYEAQCELPYVHHIEVQRKYVNNETGEEFLQWDFQTETVDYEFSVGQVAFYFTQSDFDYEIDETVAPVAMDFRCVILY